MTEPTELPPTPGSRWTHRNGAPYTVLMIANADTQDEARYPVTVVYQGDNGKVWSRPASDWHRSMTATPQPTQAQAGAVPLTDEQLYEERQTAISQLFDLAQQWADNKIHSYQFGHEAEKIVDAVARRVEAAHGIQGGQHGEPV